jgi:hypothetical protein
MYQPSIFEQLEVLSAQIDFELRQSAEREGFDKAELTGKIIMDSPNEALWFEVVDVEYRVLSYVSLDFPERAAHGEKLVGIGDESEIQDYNRGH